METTVITSDWNEAKFQTNLQELKTVAVVRDTRIANPFCLYNREYSDGDDDGPSLSSGLPSKKPK